MQTKITAPKVEKLYKANLKTAKELEDHAAMLEDQAKQVREAAAYLMGERDTNQ